MAKKVDSNWFVEERSHALAMMHLTRRPDLVIREESHKDWGLDFIVEIAKDESASLRVFGVQVKGSASAVTDDQANKFLMSTFDAFLRVEHFYFPICVFYFTMADNKARYTWVAEPVVTQRGKPKLERRTKAECEILDVDSLGLLVERVDSWYEALGKSLSVEETR